MSCACLADELFSVLKKHSMYGVHNVQKPLPGGYVTRSTIGAANVASAQKHKPLAPAEEETHFRRHSLFWNKYRLDR